MTGMRLSAENKHQSRSKSVKVTGAEKRLGRLRCLFFPFRFRFWRNKSVLLFNMVLADVLLVACLPVSIYYYQHNKRRSSNMALCKVMHFMLFLNRGASIAFLVMLSIDRYFSVVHLGRRNFVKILKKTPQTSIVIWLLLLPLTIPTMLKTFECCNSHGRQNETEWHDVTDTFREVKLRRFKSWPAAQTSGLRALGGAR